MLTRLLALAALTCAASCASTVISAKDRVVADEFAGLAWHPATAAELAGHWRVRRIQGPAAAVLMDISYWIDADGRFSGAALFSGPPPTYQVLSGTWTLAADGLLQLGEDAEAAQAEVASRVAPLREVLRLTGAEGSLVFERAEVQ
ncbi:MAG: hypothetical protein EXS08_06635 [Planctomycetes bacterium]|nr:hypothetical protein [Planctomycetota bacterium]